MEGVAGAAGRPSIGQPPQQPSSGRMMFRVSPAGHRPAARAAELSGFSARAGAEFGQFDAQPELDRDAILQVCGGAFVAEAANVVLVGGVGTGKTPLAIALGMACCQHDYRVRFLTAAEVTTRLVEAPPQGRLARKLDPLARFDVVIVDERGYVPFDKAGADLLFGFISRRDERGSLVVTTTLPFARWSEVFLDATAAAAVIDRIVHQATGLTTTGDSDRRKAAPTEPDGPRSTEEHALMGTRRDVASRRSAPSGHVATTTRQRGPFSRCHQVPFLLAISTQTGGGDGDPPGRGVRCPGHPPPHREATARIAKHPICSPAGVSPAGGHGAGRPVSPGATGSARPRRVPRWPRRCSARPSARFSTPRRASRRWWTRRAR